MEPDVYCEQKAAQSGSSFYYSFLFLPEDRRRAITALYAFCREVDDVVDECTDAGVARVKLAWWRNEVAAVYAGAPASVRDRLCLVRRRAPGIFSNHLRGRRLRGGRRGAAIAPRGG